MVRKLQILCTAIAKRSSLYLHLWQIYLQGGYWWTWAESVQPWISSSLEQIEFTPSWYEQRYRGDSRRPWIESESEDSLKRYILLGHKRDCRRVSSFKPSQWTDKDRMWLLEKRIAIDRRCRDKAGGWTRQIILEDYEYSLVGSRYASLWGVRGSRFSPLFGISNTEGSECLIIVCTFKALLSLNWRLIRRSILLNLDS